MRLPTNDELCAEVARRLRERAQDDAAEVLRACALRITAGPALGETQIVDVQFTGSPTAQRILNDGRHPVTQAIRDALRESMPAQVWIERWECLLEPGSTAGATHVMDVPAAGPLMDIAHVAPSHNQAVDATTGPTWNNLRFRSVSEMHVAQALDRVGVLYLANCKARLGPVQSRQNREPDFLICYEGKWGILEVDGEPFHPPSRTVHDHERDRLFKQSGIRIVEHFDANKCYEQADEVVRVFLDLLKQA